MKYTNNKSMATCPQGSFSNATWIKLVFQVQIHTSFCQFKETGPIFLIEKKKPFKVEIWKKFKLFSFQFLRIRLAMRF